MWIRSLSNCFTKKIKLFFERKFCRVRLNWRRSMFAFCHVLECSWEKKKEGESQKERERERSIKRETMSVKSTKRENTDRKKYLFSLQDRDV